MSTKSSVAEAKRYKNEADAKFEGGSFPAAIDLYTKAIQATSPITSVSLMTALYGNRSVAYFMASDFEHSLQDALEAFKRSPTNYKMLHRGACAAWTLGDLAKANELLSQIPAHARSDPVEADYDRCAAGAEISEKLKKVIDTPEGDALCKKLMALFPECPGFYLQAARSLVKRTQFLAAAKILESYAEDSRPPAYSRLMGQCFYMSGCEYLKSATDVLQLPAERDEDCAQLRRHIQSLEAVKSQGDNAYKSKDYMQALKYYTEAIEKASGNTKVLRILYCNRAAAKKELFKYRESIEDCTKAIEIDPQFAKAYARRARCYMEMNDVRTAVEDFEKAVQYDSTNDQFQEEYFTAKRKLSQQDNTKESGHYVQLGVAKTATEKEIKQKFRELSLRWHPDKCVSLSDTEKARAEVKFKLINEAYSVLSDPQKRREYDMYKDKSNTAGGEGFPFGQRVWRDPNKPRTKTKAGKTGWW